MPKTVQRLTGAALAFTLIGALATCDDDNNNPLGPEAAEPDQVREGREIFRFDTYGSEPFWSDTLRMHEVIRSAVDPTTALKVGLKVDAEKLPQGFLRGADLTSPATTVELLRRNAVVGIMGRFDASGNLTGIGVTCGLCHSTVDNSVQAGIGRRIDGPPNRDLNVGAIIALSPALPEGMKAVLRSWGPGKYDARLFVVQRTGGKGPTLIPPAYGLQGVNLHTWTGEGSIPYWNSYVAVTQIRGKGTFRDPRLGVDIRHTPDLVTSKLPALHAYQLSLEAPRPPAGSFDAAAAQRGEGIFNGPAKCSTCHVPPLFTDATGHGLHAPEETGMDPFVAQHSTTGMYRTAPLRGLWQHPPYFHDGSAPTLAAVVDHYSRVLKLNLTAEQKRDLVEYLKSL